MDTRRFKEIFLYPPNRRQKIGAIKNYEHFTGDYRFGAASEISFQVRKNYYNLETEKWETNLLYDKLNKNMVLYVDDDTDYFTFNGYKIDENLYHLKSDEEIGLSDNITNTWFHGSAMLLLMDTHKGYQSKRGCWINSKGGVDDHSLEMFDITKFHEGKRYCQCSVCESFIPVENGDIIKLTDWGNKYDGERYRYKVHYYYEADALSYLGVAKGFEHDYQACHNPEEELRVRVELPSYQIYEGSTIKPTKGYARIEWVCLKDDIYEISEDGSKIASVNIDDFPPIYVYSKNLWCRSFNVDNQTNSDFSTKLKWWVITNIEETIENGNNSVKTVSAHSYEYVISQKHFSLSGCTLPLYVPDSIPRIVTSDDFPVDIRYIEGEKEIIRGSRYMERGLLNQVLDYLPNWKIGYIDPEVSLLYRTFDEIDNGNIYSFLINEVQKAYQCYFIFDTDSMEISFISGKMLSRSKLGYNSEIALTWNNAIKSLNITTSDSQLITALRVKMSDDSKFEISLVNPTGNNYIYNFDSLKPYMDFVADEDKNRTLAKAVDELSLSISGDSYDYKMDGAHFIESSNRLVELKNIIAKDSSKYKAVADKINILLEAEGSSERISENPLLTDDYSNIYPDTKYKALYQELYQLVYNIKYNNITLTGYIADCKRDYNYMKEIAEKNTLDYNVALQRQKDGKATILSPKEILALNDFIYEGTWANDNAVIDDVFKSGVGGYNYYATDEIQKVRDQAQSDLDDVLSKPTYEFEVSLANIAFIPEMKGSADKLRLGWSIMLEDKIGQWQRPVLLEIHVDYDDLSNYSYRFSTNYKRKPLSMRFTDLFDSISQTSVQNSDFTFND